MDSRSRRWLTISALAITTSSAWTQQSAPLASDQASMANRGSGTPKVAQCSLPTAFDEKSIAALKQQAASGDAAAQCGLGLMYEEGKGAPQDYVRAGFWYRKAAEQGDTQAQSRLGYLYCSGHGVSQDYTQAVLWFRKAAEQGNAEAQSMLGALYHDGHGVPQDYAESYFWYDLAAAGELDSLLSEQMAKYRDEAASLLTPADLSREQERARKWFDEHQTKPQ